MKKMTALVAFALAVATGAVSAHGDMSHDGFVKRVGKLQFALEQEKNGAVIYVEDHGKPVPTAGATGELTVINGAEKKVLPLVPSGTNTMVTKGDIKIGQKSKATATISFGDRKPITVKFPSK